MLLELHQMTVLEDLVVEELLLRLEKVYSIFALVSNLCLGEAELASLRVDDALLVLGVNITVDYVSSAEVDVLHGLALGHLGFWRLFVKVLLDVGVNVVFAIVHGLVIRKGSTGL